MILRYIRSEQNKYPSYYLLRAVTLLCDILYYFLRAVTLLCDVLYYFLRAFTLLCDIFSRFTPFQHNDDEEYQSYENTAVFNVSCFQYIILAVMFAQGAPFRKNLLSNIPFLINLLLCVAVALWLIIYPSGMYRDGVTL